MKEKKALSTGFWPEFKRFFLLGFVGIPIATVLVVAAYGFLVWFGQMLFWGPPK